MCKEDSRIITHASKLMLCLAFLCLHAGMVQSQNLANDEPDILYCKSIELKIKGKPGKGLKLESRVNVEQTYLSERSTYANDFYVFKGAFEELKDVEARFRGKKLSKDRIGQLSPSPQDIFYSEYRAFCIVFPENIRPGETVYYSYRKKYKDIAFLPVIPVPNLNKVTRITVLVKHPKEVKVGVHTFFPREKLTYAIEHITQEKTKITFAPIDYFRHLSFYAFNDLHALLFLRLTWNGEPINPVEPIGFLQWYQKKVVLMPNLDQAVVNSLNLDFVKCLNAYDTLCVINDFVTSNIRYIAEQDHPHSIVPHPPATVLANRYGDCKDRASLVSALARTCGINVDMALTMSRPQMIPGTVHPALFDHVICHYDGDGIPLFFDPTAKFHPCGSLPEEIIGCRALILDPGRPQVVNLTSSLDNPLVDIHVKGHVDSLDDCRATIILRNSRKAMALQAAVELAGFKLQAALAEIMSCDLYRMSLDSITIDTVTPDRLVLSARTNLSAFIVRSDTRSYVPKCPFDIFGNSVMDRADDPWPIHLEYRNFSTLEIVLVAPSLQVTADSVALKAPGKAEFQARVRNDGAGNIRFSYTIQLPCKNIPPADKPTFLDFFRHYLSGRAEMFILKEEGI